MLSSSLVGAVQEMGSLWAGLVVSTVLSAAHQLQGREQCNNAGM
jgi:hypothetical protein